MGDGQSPEQVTPTEGQLRRDLSEKGWGKLDFRVAAPQARGAGGRDARAARGGVPPATAAATQPGSCTARGAFPAPARCFSSAFLHPKPKARRMQKGAGTRVPLSHQPPWLAVPCPGSARRARVAPDPATARLCRAVSRITGKRSARFGFPGLEHVCAMTPQAPL